MRERRRQRQFASNRRGHRVADRLYVAAAQCLLAPLRGAVALLTMMPAIQTDRKFPVLTPEQLERVAARGQYRRARAGEAIVQVGERAPNFYALKSGELEVVQQSRSGPQVIATHSPGEFTGEVSMLAGRRSVVDVRARTESELIELPRAALLALVQSDSELSEILMRAFVLRRAELVAIGSGDLVLVGSLDHVLYAFPLGA